MTAIGARASYTANGKAQSSQTQSSLFETISSERTYQLGKITFESHNVEIVCGVVCPVGTNSVPRRIEDGKVVKTQQGPVKGYLSKEGNYFEFLGIPYATAPKGNNKFKAPLDPPSWSNVREPTNIPIVCPQPTNEDFPLDLGNQDEDCLQINVFVPNNELTNLPVMVHVHGGGFIGGAGTMFSHEPLLRHDIIAINFNYRLGVYGFLCLGTEDVPGNAGLKDQVAALRWVKRNIASFGGNPDDVTIDGGSAGSASVEHLMLSPMTKGLFTKVIAESGSALAPWAFNPDPIAMAKRYMKDISGISTDDVNEIEEFYKSLTTNQLLQELYLEEPDTTLGFAPCVEPTIEGEESFYNESPLDILKRGDYSKVLFMPGFATEEGLFRIGQFDRWSKKMNENFAEFLPQDLQFSNENEKMSIAAKVKKFYFKDALVNENTLKEYVEYFTDVVFGYSAVRSARLHALNSVSVYLYDISYISNIQLPNPYDDKFKGADHCAQTILIHKVTFLGQLNYTKNDLLVQKRLTNIWANFIKLGTPVTSTSELLPVSWEPVDPDRLNYLHIDLEFEARDHLLGERYKLWDEIYQQYYRQPVAPSGILKKHSEL